ncbi:MAG TPA: hypothetical protein VD788_11100 [Candidatus Polarisedimenticolaceae bacterium]|nr:hypothetical protein [Candidatus Polarisedimenticolaceae bacterium]
MRDKPRTCAVLALTALAVGCGGERAGSVMSDDGDGAATAAVARTKVFETEPLPIDRIYHSMQGPFDRIQVDHTDLDWVTAVHTEVIDADTGEPMGGEFFCHSQVQLLNGTRLMVMATGADTIRFPQGFAMPVSSIMRGVPAEQRALTFLGMVLNNHETEIDRRGKVRTTVEYLRDVDLGQAGPPKKLFRADLTMFVEDLEEYVPDDAGLEPNDDVTTHCALVGELPQHWIVPPGKQKTRYRYTDFVPVDGRVHFGWVHLHNYGVYMRLTDVTTGDVLFQADVENEPDRDQIRRISNYSSEEGFPLYRDHVYEIEALYDNTTGHDVDAMAMMVLYYHPDGNVDITYPAPPAG